MRRSLFAIALLGAALAATSVAAPPAHAAPCSSTSGFKPQIELPAGFGLSSPGITDAAAYDGVVDFGDGTTVDVALNQPFEHTFTKPGTYPVTSTGQGLEFTSDGGTAPCEESQFPITTVTVYPLEARISVGEDGGDQPGTGARYTFDGSSSIPQGKILEYSWDFGDGSFASGSSATHEYTAPGAFEVRLSILDANGYPASATKTVSSGDIVVIDPSGVPEQPRIDPNEFVALGSAAAEGSDDGSGGGSGLWMLLVLGGVLAAAAGLLLFLRSHRPAIGTAVVEGPMPPPGPAGGTETGQAPIDQPETIGYSGIEYGQDRKRTVAAKRGGDLLNYYDNFEDEVGDTVDNDAAADAKLRAERIKYYMEEEHMSQADAELLADRDLAQYGSNLPMVNEVIKDALWDAPIETAKDKVKWLGDLWNKAFPPKP